MATDIIESGGDPRATGVVSDAMLKTYGHRKNKTGVQEMGKHLPLPKKKDSNIIQFKKGEEK